MELPNLEALVSEVRAGLSSRGFAEYETRQHGYPHTEEPELLRFQKIASPIDLEVGVIADYLPRGIVRQLIYIETSYSGSNAVRVLGHCLFPNPEHISWCIEQQLYVEETTGPWINTNNKDETRYSAHTGLGFRKRRSPKYVGAFVTEWVDYTCNIITANVIAVKNTFATSARLKASSHNNV